MTSEFDETLSFEIMDDPEMTDVGHRLIGQGGDLLDDTDLSQAERKKVEKALSECWNHLYRVKTRKNNFFKIQKDYRNGKSLPEKQKLGVPEELGEFVHLSVKTLDQVSKLIGLSTQSSIRWVFSKDQKEKISGLFSDLKGRFGDRSNNLILILQKTESTWIGPLIKLWMQIRETGALDYVSIKKGAMLQCGRPEMEITMKDGRSLEQFFSATWDQLVDFCEEFMAYTLQLRFLGFIEGLEMIPKEQRDPVYPRRFRTVVSNSIQKRED